MSFITNLNQQQRKRLHQITLVATFGGLLFGYDTGVINGAFSSLKQYMALTPTTEGLVMSVLLVGAALGSVFGGKFADYFGRRKYLLFLSFVFLIGALLSAAAPDITTLLIARALLGYATHLISLYDEMEATFQNPDSHGLLRVEELARRLGVSRQHLALQFRQQVGIGNHAPGEPIFEHRHRRFVVED